MKTVVVSDFNQIAIQRKVKLPLFCKYYKTEGSHICVYNKELTESEVGESLPEEGNVQNIGSRSQE